MSVLLLLFLLLLIQGFSSNEIYISSNGSSEASCGSIHSPCLSLSDITQWENDTVVFIEGSIVLDRVIEIHSIHNLNFTSSSASSNKKEKAAVINCVCPSYDNCGLIIEDCQDVAFNELNISGCSMLHQMPGHYYRSGIVMNTTTDILLSNVSISNSIGTGLLLINADGSITIEGSVFSSNAIPYALQQNGSNGNAVHGGAGLVILISACEITAKKCSHVSASGNYSILGTLFHNNTVNLTKENLKNRLLSYGGGLGIFLVWNVQGNTFNIKGTNFTGNKATVGGGMLWHCMHYCHSNTINFEKCHFSNNLFSHEDFGGAGLAMGFARYSGNMSANNNISVSHTIFSNNTGYYASGVLIYCNAMDPNQSIHYNYVHFINCTWESNIGTAIEIEPNFESQYYAAFTTMAIFEDCIFANNTIIKHYDQIYPYTFSEGFGAFVITKLTIHFKGKNFFNNNNGTALYILSGSAYFETGAVTIFNNNTGTYGGAIGLVGYSSIQYNDDTTFEFTNNSASFVGGAIYVVAIRPHISLSSHSCFLQYRNNLSYENDEINARFVFKNNWSSTGIANSIYITSTKPCQLACGTQPNELFVNQTCLGVFEFTNYSKAIASGGSAFTVSQPTPLSIIPGRKCSLPITLYDDIHQNVTKIAIFQPTLPNEGNISVSTGFEFLSNKKIKITGKPGEKGNLTLKVTGFQNKGASIGIELASCPPGYIIDDDSSSCVCSASNNDKSLTYVGIYRCDESKEVALALKGYWAGYVLTNKSATPNPSNLYTSDCPLGFCRSYNKSFYSLTGSASKNELEQVVCAENRIGTLCGQCKKGYSVYFHSTTNKCGRNHHCASGYAYYVLSELLPITGLFFTILYFDISLTTGLAYNFLFIVQLLQTVVESVNIGTDFKSFEMTRSIYTVLYSTLNLDFFDIDKLSFCLWNGATTLEMISIQYVSVVYAVLLIIGLVYAFKCCCCSKCKCCTKNYSVVQGLTAFLVLSYFKCAFITFKLLDHRIIRGIGLKNYRYVVFWDGSLEYFSTHHLWYAIPALICFFLFIIPFPLILTFDGLLLKVESKLAIRFAFIRRLMPWTAIHYKLKPLLDSFQGPFKDQYRFFAGLYFFYRLLLLSLFVMASTEFQYYFYLAIALTLIIMIQATVQPFQEKKHNICAALTFTNMALINLFTVCIFFLESHNGYKTEAIIAQCIQIILIYIPLVAVALWLLRTCYYKAKVKGHTLDNDGSYGELLFDRSAGLSALHENS